MDDKTITPEDAESRKSAGPDLRSKDRTRRDKIAIIAYYRAQRRGFANSGELDDWLSAEREVDAAESKFKSPDESAGTRNL